MLTFVRSLVNESRRRWRRRSAMSALWLWQALMSTSLTMVLTTAQHATNSCRPYANFPRDSVPPLFSATSSSFQKQKRLRLSAAQSAPSRAPLTSALAALRQNLITEVHPHVE